MEAELFPTAEIIDTCSHLSDVLGMGHYPPA
jgi:hypothetical protein